MNAHRRNQPLTARALIGPLAVLLGLLACNDGGGGGGGGAALHATPTHSSTLALTSDGRTLVVVNRETDTVAVLRVRDAAGTDDFEELAEVAVGREPRSVALTPDDELAFVTNAASGTVSVVDIGGASIRVVAEIPVGTEPRGVVTTPSGARVYVANYTAGTLSVIDTGTLQVVDTVTVGGNPSALAVSNDGDGDDDDETVFVTQFFAELIPGGPGEGFDDGKQGVVHAVPVSGAAAPAKITLAPLADAGFAADRGRFCAAFNANLHSEIFCPDNAIIDALDPVIAQDPQAAFPNQLQSLVLRDGLLYAPSIGAQPEPPVKFNVNVQGLVHVVDAASASEIPDRTINLNAQIKLEVQPAVPNQSLGRLFANDVVAIDADAEGEQFLIVSRGGNCVLRATLDANGKLDLGAPDVVRFQTGNIPNGVVISPDGERAYVNNEVNISVTVIDLANELVVERDLPTGTPPAPGSFPHSALVGKLVFHTALGVPDFGLFGTPVRAIVPLASRGKASDNAWSSCASCHGDGLADNVTWIFGTGPRQTLPLDAFFSKQSPLDQRISNYSAVMGSVTDFNNNAIGVQGGTGFAGQPPPAGIFQHGVTEGASDSLDAMTLWVQTIRPLEQPAPSDLAAAASGELLFAESCASCHGGAKWTKSQVVYDNNPTFDTDPNGTGTPFDAGVLNAKAQIRSFTEAAETLDFLEDIGTFDAQSPLELRGQGGTQGEIALGVLGYNVPALLSIRSHAPYLHDGSAQTFDEVFQKHELAGGTIATELDVQELADLKEFLSTIDGATPTTPSASDLFLQRRRAGG